MPEKLKSRMFWFALIGALGNVLVGFLSQSVTLEQALINASAIVISYLFGQGYKDAQAAKLAAAKVGASSSP